MHAPNELFALIAYILIIHKTKENKMIGAIIRLLLLALALFFVAWAVPGISLAGFVPALWAALAIGLINIFIKPLILLLTLPINLLTLGLFTFIINALLFWLVGNIVPGFVVSGFLAALLGSILLSIVSLLINMIDI